METGSIYALAALGIIIIYRTSYTTNFAQGAVAMGFLIDVLILRHTKNVSPVAKQIITLGLIMIVLGLAPIFFGVDPLRLPRLIESGDLSFLGASISYNGLFNIALGLAIMLLMFYILQKTKWGLAIRTTASNEYVARLMGVPTKNVTMAAWGVAGVLGVIAGVMTAPMTSVTLNLMDEVQITALVACVLGGFQTFHGPVIGAYIMGIVRNLLLFYVSSVWGGQILYILILVFIVFRPYGLIGKKIVKKV